MTNAQRRNSYTFKEGLTMMAAKSVGIDPDLAAEAGDGARAAINAIRHAAKAKSAKDRAALIRTAQSELRTINASKHPKVVNAIQARLLALQGRGGDTEIAHLTPGEVVIPRKLQTPAVMRALAAEAQRQGINPARLSVGNTANSRNPRTGQREFMEEIIVTGTKDPVIIPQWSGDGGGSDYFGEGFNPGGGASAGGSAEGGDDQPIEEIVVVGSRLEAIRAEPHLATDQQLRWAMDQIWDNAWENMGIVAAIAGLDLSLDTQQNLEKLKTMRGKRALVFAMALGIPIGGYWLYIATPIIAEMNKRGIE